ncbi:MAG: hypothetical protein LBV38_01540 [Alistipes sp.]|jgi:hypothetical protein|nr:hypothetical protein [Alistipes sp.]
MTHFQLAVATGIAVGVLDVAPMIFRRISGRSCVSAFLLFFFASIIVFYSDLPYLPWWADGVGITLAMMLPVLFTFVGKDRGAIPVVVFNVLIFGVLISLAERFLPQIV